MSLSTAMHEIFSEPGPNGTLSWGRVASAFSLAAALVWISYVVHMTHALPALDGITAFILAPYAANKTATVVQSFSSNPVPGK